MAPGIINQPQKGRKMLGPYQLNQVITGHSLDVLAQLPPGAIHACITSPPYYGLRNYGIEPVAWPAVTFAPMAGLPEMTIPEQVCCLGLEKDIWSYVGHLVAVFREVRRVLRDDGTLWLNLGDSYAGNGEKQTGRNDNGRPEKDRGWAEYDIKRSKIKVNTGLKPKDLMLIPARVALALQGDGWYLRSDVIWHKSNPMPESVTDRPTKAHEYVYLLSKSERYYYDAEAVKEGAVKGYNGSTFTDGKTAKAREHLSPIGQGERQNQSGESGRNRRSVWTVATQPFSGAHFAVFPAKLIEPMILASTSEVGVCGACGGPWVRVVEKVGKSLPVSERHGRTGHNGQPPQISGNYWTGPTTKATGDWQPSCACDAATVPAVVLDPFGGSGTTGAVALKHRRNFILIDANPTYATELAAERLNGTQIQMMAAWAIEHQEELETGKAEPPEAPRLNGTQITMGVF